MKTKRVDGETPSGGDYSEIFYMDKNHNMVDEKEATICIIRECKSDGTLVRETIGFCNNNGGKILL